MSWSDDAGRWAAPLIALAFLALTGILLIWDLRKPWRFYLIFTRHQWRSWLVRGSFIIGGYGGAAALYLAGSLAGSVAVRQVAAGFALPLALAAACYTAYLFAQARARDLRQSPLLAPHLAVQAVLAGAAVILPFAQWLSPGAAVTGAEVLLAAAAAAHMLLVRGEITVTHPTEHARLAAHAMTGGRYARFFWPGLAAVAVAVAAPWAGVVVVPFALAGLLAHEHAHVQAGHASVGGPIPPISDHPLGVPVHRGLVVFGEDSAHGTSMMTMVGPPMGLLTARMPSNAASRRSIPARPVLRAGARRGSVSVPGEPGAGSAPPMPLS